MNPDGVHPNGAQGGASSAGLPRDRGGVAQVRATSPAAPGATTYVAPSRIHGHGLFAARSIAEGEVIGRFEGRDTLEDGEHVLWVEQEDSSYRGIEGTTDLRFLNHSRRPNSEFEADLLIALHPIPSDEEITIHYGEAWED